MNLRMLIMLTAAALVFGGVFGFKWFGNRMMNQYFDHMPVPAVTVSTAKAIKDKWDLTLTAVGTIEAEMGTEVTTEASGIVDSISFESGGTVAAGQVLVTLDRSTDNAELAALVAAGELAELELGRARNLINRSAVAEAELDRRASTASAAKAQVDAQRARIAQKVIRAPFAGELGIRKVDLGDHLSPGTGMVTLQSLDPIFVNFMLPQQQLGDVRVGLPIEIGVEAFGDRDFRGTITAIEPRIDTATRSFEVQAKLANPEKMLRPGMFAQVHVELGASEEVTVVPQTSVSYNPYGDSVWVLVDADGKRGVERRLVQLGRRRGDLVQVVGGVQAGDEIATSGLLKLRNGVPVEVNNDIQPGAESAPRPPNS
jgi:membrane fusion protein (multidrug efflux system)